MAQRLKRAFAGAYTRATLAESERQRWQSRSYADDALTLALLALVAILALLFYLHGTASAARSLAAWLAADGPRCAVAVFGRGAHEMLLVALLMPLVTKMRGRGDD